MKGSDFSAGCGKQCSHSFVRRSRTSPQSLIVVGFSRSGLLVYRLIWSTKLRIDTHSLHASHKAIISAWLEEVAVKDCFELLHEIVVPPWRKTYLVWDLASSGSDRYGFSGPRIGSTSVRFLKVSFEGSEDLSSIGVLTGCADAILNDLKIFLIYVD